jgi:CheY-like chemotaxis protein
MAAAGTSTLVEFEIAEDLHPVEIDGVQFVQVFTNLILNSIQMMPDNGRVWIRGINAPLGEVNTVSLPAGEYVRIDVQDNGPGIPADRIKSIFDAFYTTRSDGTGLGLPMAKSIISQHGGGIEAVSTVGSGTTFTIFIPRASSEIVENTSKPAAASFGSGRILIVDDDEDLCIIAKGMLETLGFQGETACTASDAITRVRKLAEIGRKYSAVVLDMNMPGEMPGDELLVHLREIDPSLKAVVSSGYGTEQHWKQYEQQGFDTMLAKPYRSSDLGASLKKVIAEGEEEEVVVAAPSGGKPVLRTMNSKPPPPPPPPPSE